MLKTSKTQALIKEKVKQQENVLPSLLKLFPGLFFLTFAL